MKKVNLEIRITYKKQTYKIKINNKIYNNSLISDLFKVHK